MHVKHYALLFPGGNELMIPAGLVAVVCWWPMFFLISSLALNRYIVICKGPGVGDYIFGGSKRYYWMGGCLVLGG